jgi:hypothetical protein
MLAYSNHRIPSLTYRRALLNPSGSDPLAPYASLTSANTSSTWSRSSTDAPFIIPASALPFFSVKVPLPSPTSPSIPALRNLVGLVVIVTLATRDFDLVLVAGEPSCKDIFSLSRVSRPLGGVILTFLAGVVAAVMVTPGVTLQIGA